MVRLEADMRIGGRLSFTMMSFAGTFSAEGVYELIEPPTRLVHSWRWTEGPPQAPPSGNMSRVTYELERIGEGTRLTLTHEDLSDQDDADAHEQGWTDALDTLEELLVSDSSR